MHTGLICSGLGTIMSTALTKTLEDFDKDASRYQTDIYERKRSDLYTIIEARLHVLFISQIVALRKGCAKKCIDVLQAKIKSKELYNFRILSQSTSLAILGEFDTEASACIPKGLDWSYTVERNLLIREIDDAITQLRNAELRKSVTRMEKIFKTRLDDLIPPLFDDISDRLWDCVLLLFRQELTAHEKSYANKSEGNKPSYMSLC